MEALVGVLRVGLSILVFSATITLFVFWLVGRITARAISTLEPEGIEKRSGPRWIRTKLRDFRNETRMASHRISVNRGELVLVPGAFVVAAGTFLVRFDNADLPSAEVWVDGERLHFVSTKPSGGTGTVDVRVPLPDASDWLEALRSRGARIRG
jgi:hypothetical protein